MAKHKDILVGKVVRTKQHPHQGKDFRIIGRLKGVPTTYPAMQVGERKFNGSTVVNLVGELIIKPTNPAAKLKALELLKSADPVKRQLGMKLLQTINKKQ